MSGLVKGIKKVFKKVAKVVKKIAKPLAIAAAVYFTAGVAMAAFPATQAFAASLPGFAGSGGAATGIFSKAASAIGLGGLGPSGGLAAAAAKGAAGGVAAGMSAGAGAGLIETGVTGALPGVISTSTAGAGAGAAGTSLVSKIAAGWKGMSMTDKLLVGSFGMQGMAALSAPSTGEIEEAVQAARAKFRGAFYGQYDQPTSGESIAPEALPRMAGAPEVEQSPASQPQRELIAPPGGVVPQVKPPPPPAAPGQPPLTPDRLYKSMLANVRSPADRGELIPGRV